MNARDAKALRMAPLETPTDLESNAVRDLAGALNILRRGLTFHTEHICHASMLRLK